MHLNRRRAPLALRTSSTNDPDQAAALMRRMHPTCEWLQPKGRADFRFRQSIVTLGGVGITRHATTAFDTNLHRVDTAIRALVVTEGEATATCGKRQSPINGQHGLRILPPESIGSFSDGYAGMSLAVPVDRMASLLRSMHCDAAPLDFASRHWQSTGFSGLSVTRALRHAFAELEQDGDALLAVPAAAAALGDLLGYHLARVIACNVRPNAERAPSAALRRCLDFLEGHSRGKIDIVDMAHYANIGLRSAQALFARELGTSITAHLRHIRLERVRQRIEAGTCVTIAATALEEGFTHLGEFGQSYLTRFGERPSDTLRRNRHR